MLLVVAAGWLLLSPLLIDRSIHETPDFALPGSGVDRGRIMAMPAARRGEMMQHIMDTAAEAPDRTTSESMPATGPSVVAVGRFVDADAVHMGSGTATVYALPSHEHVVRFEDLSLTNGPDLVVYLAKHPDPKDAVDVTAGGFVKLGKLKGNVGNQNYAVPTDIDVSKYGSVVIWCELFGVLFSPAALSRDAA